MKDSIMKGVQRLDYDLVFNTDLLHYSRYESDNRVTVNGRHVTIEGNPDISAANGIIAEFFYVVHLTKDSVTDIALGDLQLNVGLSSLCDPTIQSTSDVFSYRYYCGDKTTQDFIRGTLPFQVIALYPNPASDELTIRLAVFTDEAVEARIYNILGEEVKRTELRAGNTPIGIGTLPEGSYFIRLSQQHYTATRNFLIKK